MDINTSPLEIGFIFAFCLIYSLVTGTASRTSQLQGPGKADISSRMAVHHLWKPEQLCWILLYSIPLEHHELVMSLENSELTPSDNTHHLGVFLDAQLSLCARVACLGHAGLSTEEMCLVPWSSGDWCTARLLLCAITADHPECSVSSLVG